jgi:hypothetical protein
MLIGVLLAARVPEPVLQEPIQSLRDELEEAGVD